jgi:tRNA threonylcarbamoyladenosine biosynthesis protein TsaB
MLLLAADTSGQNGSIALAEATDGQSRVKIVEVLPLDGHAFSAQLVPQISALLQKHGHSKDHLSALAVVTGPGSFTGLRVGLAAIKAFAEALRKPIVAISLLEALARTGNARSRVLAVLDAGRTDIYVGDYEVEYEADSQDQAKVHMHSERLLSREEFLTEAPGAPIKTVLTPDPILAAGLRSAGIEVELVDYPGSSVIAQFGWEHLQRGETVRAEDLEANYLRHSTAAKISAKPH